MPSINDLPEEVLLQIFQAARRCFFTPNEILKLLLVSRKFYRLCLPVLYEELIDWNRGYDQRSARRHAKLCFILLFDPVRTAFVRHLEIKAISFRYDGFTEDDLTPERHEQLVRLVGEPLNLDRLSMTQLMIGAAGRLPNLRELYIDGMDCSSWAMFEHSIETTIEANSRVSMDGKHDRIFPCLRTVTLVALELHTTFLSPIWNVSALGSVQHVNCPWVVNGQALEFDKVDEYPKFGETALNTKSLSLWPCSRVHDRHLMLFLGKVKKLESFSYHIDCHRKYPHVSTTNLTRALDQHQHSLRVINLNLRCGPPMRIRPRQDWARMTFGDFSCLERLDISFALLIGLNDKRSLAETPNLAVEDYLQDSLPKSLKVLQISQCDGKHQARVANDAARVIVERKLLWCPELKELSVVVAEKVGVLPLLFAWLSVDQMISKAAENGVSYQVRRYKTDDAHGPEVIDEDAGTGYDGYGAYTGVDFEILLQDQSSSEEEFDDDEDWLMESADPFD